MADLRQQALAIINVCKTALAGKGKDQHAVDNQTIAIAQALLAEAKTLLPNDKVLASVNLEPPVPFWTTVQTAMEMVAASVPTPEAFKLGEAMEKARKRVEAAEQPIQDAISSYKAALAEYEHLAQTESPSYSIIEIPKLKVADAFLESRGIPTRPRTAEKVGIN
jgi:hypothetical protein